MDLIKISSLQFCIIILMAGCSRQGEVISVQIDERLHHEVVYDGSPAEDGSTDLVIFFSGEQHGELGLCGCDEPELGSLSRVVSYQESAKRQYDAPTLTINGGNWLHDVVDSDGALRLDVLVANRWMIRGLAEYSWDALNVGFRDWPYLLKEQTAPAGVISGGVVGGSGPEVETTRLFQLGSTTVGLVAVSASKRGYLLPKGAEYREPLAVVEEGLVALASSSPDVVVVVGYDLGADATSVAQMSGVDVLLETGGYKNFERPIWKPMEALRVRSRFETHSLTELHLTLIDGEVVSAQHRVVMMNDAVGKDAGVEKIAKQASKELDRVRRALFGDP